MDLFSKEFDAPALFDGEKEEYIHYNGDLIQDSAKLIQSTFKDVDTKINEDGTILVTKKPIKFVEPETTLADLKLLLAAALSDIEIIKKTVTPQKKKFLGLF